MENITEHYNKHSKNLQLAYRRLEDGGIEFQDKVRYSEDEIHRLRRASSLYSCPEKYKVLCQKVHLLKQMDPGIEVGLVFSS